MADDGFLTPPSVAESDGLPAPYSGATAKRQYPAICLVCFGDCASVQLHKKGGYSVRCTACANQLFLNTIRSISMFRGFQRLLRTDPVVLEGIRARVLELAPKD